MLYSHERLLQAGKLNQKTALIIGSTSDIGRALARRLVNEGYALQLAARALDLLELETRDLGIRTRMEITSYKCDLLDDDSAISLLDKLNPLPDVAVCVVGLLGEQAESERNVVLAETVMRSNYVGPALLMGELAARFQQRGSGVLVGFSSVSGDRGRAANYVYGSAKAGLTEFLSGLRNRLTNSGVHVITVKPGYVSTRMTDGMKLPSSLTATPEEVALAVSTAIRTRRNVVYVRRIWWLIMLIIRILPEWIFKRMKL